MSSAADAGEEARGDLRLPHVTGPLRALLVTLLFAAVFAGILMAYFHRDLSRRAENAARQDLNRVLAASYDAVMPLTPAGRVDWLRSGGAPGANSTAVVLLLDQDRAVVCCTAGKRQPPRSLGGEEFTIPGADGSEQLIGRIQTLTDGQSLFVGIHLAPYRDGIASTLQAIALTALALYLPFALLTLLWQRQLRGRLRAMITGARQIGEGDLALRFAVRRSGDEFDAISQHMNAMVGQLANMKAAVEDQAIHIRHEYLHSAGRIARYVDRLRLSRDDDEALAAIDQEQKNLVATTAAILNLSRARAELIERDSQDLKQVAEDVLSITEDAADLKNQELRRLLAPAPCTGSRAMLRMALSNLVSNAIKYTPEGGCIEVSTLIVGERARFHVQDSGPGVPASSRKAIFEPGQRGVALDAPGHGYGLAIALAVARTHGGELWVEDGAMGGACFVIELPLSA